MYGFEYINSDDGDVDSRPHLDTPYNYLITQYETYKFTDSTIDSSHFLSNDERGYSRLNSEIVLFVGHGHSTNGLTDGVSLPSDTALYVNQLKNMENVKVAVWAACKSADSNNIYNTSMPQASVDAGAKSAIGWPEIIGVKDTKVFTARLFNRLALGYNLLDAVNYARLGVVAWSSVRNCEISGDLDTTIVAISIDGILPISYQNISEEFRSRTSNTENWFTQYYNDGSYVVCRTINGCLTNDFYDISIKSDGTTDVTHSGVTFDKQVVLPSHSYTMQAMPTIEVNGITFGNLIKTEKKNVYHIFENVAIPIEVNFNTYETDNGLTYQDIVCINLNDGTLIDYDSISVMGENK